jgi:putative ABC transport system permease protein
MLRLAVLNLFQNRTRLLISVGGVALALTLILAFDAIFTGVEGRLALYIDRSGADVFMAQSGVRNLHMAASWLPATTVDQVRAVPGVASVTPILYVTDMITAGDDQYIAYVIGLPPDAVTGGPPRIVEGATRPRPGEAIIDRSIARRAGIGVGDRVTILAQELTVAGLTEGTTSLVNSVAFIAMDDFARMRPGEVVISFVLATVRPGESPEAVAARIEAGVDGVTAQTRRTFAAQERKLVKDMSADVIAIMNLVGFLIGLAVVALTVYTATLARRKEYGVIKALGARNSRLYRTVLAQAVVSVGIGFLLGLGLTLALTAVTPRVSEDLVLTVSGASLVKVGVLSVLIAGLSAVLPIRQIAGLDPAMVYRGR